MQMYMQPFTFPDFHKSVGVGKGCTLAHYAVPRPASLDKKSAAFPDCLFCSVYLYLLHFEGRSMKIVLT